MTGYLKTAAAAAASADVLWLITHYQPADVLQDSRAAGLLACAAGFTVAWLVTQIRRRESP
jgi:hypothetical protein